MYAERFGSYSIAATLAGIPSLRRLKSIRRYRRLAPPPRWREVLRPLALRPPVFFRPSTRLFSGSDFVISAKSGYVEKRRPGLVGLGLRMAMVYPSRPSRPWKIGMVSPARTWTIAFFHDRVRPAVIPRRLGLDLTDSVRTSTTLTSKSASTAWRICVLWASAWTRNVYLSLAAST